MNHLSDKQCGDVMVILQQVGVIFVVHHYSLLFVNLSYLFTH